MLILRGCLLVDVRQWSACHAAVPGERPSRPAPLSGAKGKENTAMKRLLVLAAVLAMTATGFTPAGTRSARLSHR